MPQLCATRVVLHSSIWSSVSGLCSWASAPCCEAGMKHVCPAMYISDTCHHADNMALSKRGASWLGAPALWCSCRVLPPRWPWGSTAGLPGIWSWWHLDMYAEPNQENPHTVLLDEAPLWQ